MMLPLGFARFPGVATNDEFDAQACQSLPFLYYLSQLWDPVSCSKGTSSSENGTFDTKPSEDSTIPA
jgi:hypothetical protein